MIIMNENERIDKLFNVISESNRKKEEEINNQNNKTKSCDYIKKKLQEYPIIIDYSIFNEIVYDMYDRLKEERYKDSDILNGIANRSINNYITDGLYNIKFKPEFDKVFKYIKGYTTSVFDDIRKDEMEYGYTPFIYFDKGRNKNLDYIAYQISSQIINNKLDVNELYHSGKLYQMIYGQIEDDIANKNSIAKDIQRESNRIERKREKKVVSYDSIKKGIIVFLILTGILAVSNTKKDNETVEKPKVTPYKTEQVIDEDEVKYTPDAFDEEIIREIIEHAQNTNSRKGR